MSDYSAFLMMKETYRTKNKTLNNCILLVIDDGCELRERQHWFRRWRQPALIYNSYCVSVLSKGFVPRIKQVAFLELRVKGAEPDRVQSFFFGKQSRDD